MCPPSLPQIPARAELVVSPVPVIPACPWALGLCPQSSVWPPRTCYLRCPHSCNPVTTTGDITHSWPISQWCQKEQNVLGPGPAPYFTWAPPRPGQGQVDGVRSSEGRGEEEDGGVSRCSQFWGDPLSFSSRILGVRLTWDDLEGLRSEGTLFFESPLKLSFPWPSCLTGEFLWDWLPPLPPPPSSLSSLPSPCQSVSRKPSLFSWFPHLLSAILLPLLPSWLLCVESFFPAQVL